MIGRRGQSLYCRGGRLVRLNNLGHRSGRALTSWTVKEFFPAELHATLEGSDGLAARNTISRAIRKKLILAREPGLAGATEEERKRALLAKLDGAAEEDGEEEEGEEEGEEEDYNYEDDEEEMGGDYDAEQYFDDGGDGGDDDEGGGGDDY